MLRLPKFALLEPASVDEVVAAIEEHGEDAQLVAGGTDLFPNMKHELFTPKVVISLAKVPELSGVRVEEDGTLVLGAMATLDVVASHAEVLGRAPALAQAVSLISGPQLRRMGTLGGNVMLDTRCQWYNQTFFWRQSLGFCLKKDGTVCHVVESGRKCVAAASNDSIPALMTLGATLVLVGSEGRREVRVEDFWHADGIYNKKSRGEVLVEVRVPRQAAGHRGAYGKLRDRGSIDFPLFGAAVRLDIEERRVVDADLCAVALQARPVRVRGAGELLVGTELGTDGFREAVEDVAQLAYKRCRPLDNVPGDADYRHEMVPVYVRRTLLAAADGSGPVHHL